MLLFFLFLQTVFLFRIKQKKTGDIAGLTSPIKKKAASPHLQKIQEYNYISLLQRIHQL